jgi:hypothetical protein
MCKKTTSRSNDAEEDLCHDDDDVHHDDEEDIPTFFSVVNCSDVDLLAEYSLHLKFIKPTSETAKQCYSKNVQAYAKECVTTLPQTGNDIAFYHPSNHDIMVHQSTVRRVGSDELMSNEALDYDMQSLMDADDHIYCFFGNFLED